jgi:hypothetical protein
MPVYKVHGIKLVCGGRGGPGGTGCFCPKVTIRFLTHSTVKNVLYSGDPNQSHPNTKTIWISFKSMSGFRMAKPRTWHGKLILLWFDPLINFISGVMSIHRMLPHQFVLKNWLAKSYKSKLPNISLRGGDLSNNQIFGIQVMYYSIQ